MAHRAVRPDQAGENVVNVSIELLLMNYAVLITVTAAIYLILHIVLLSSTGCNRPGQLGRLPPLHSRGEHVPYRSWNVNTIH